MLTTHRYLALWTLIIALTVSALRGSGTILFAAPGTAWAAGTTTPLHLPPARALALPTSTFPRTSHVTGGPVSNVAVDSSTVLHTRPLASMGRLEGYQQTAQWTPIQPKRQRHSVTVHYGAAIFSSPAGASDAYSDARASLWELGHPIRLHGYTAPAFTVSTHSQTQVHLVSHYGPVEVEMNISYARTIGRRPATAALGQLSHAGTVAARLARHLATGLAAATPAVGDALPPLYVAPLGAGPVIKSPSLMALNTAQFPVGATLGAGSFRLTGPRLRTQTTPYAALAPPAWLSRFIQLARPSQSADLYSSTALYSTVHEASLNFALQTQENDGHAWLHSIPLASYVGPGQWLSRADGIRAWRTTDESILVFRCQNVVVTLADTSSRGFDLGPQAERILAAVPSWLHTRGTAIVDAAGTPVHLAGLNWYGAEQQDFVVGGLDFQSYQTILQRIKSEGYNSIRLPFSNQLVEQDPILSAHLRANPELTGMHAMDILDRIVQYAGALGLSVILDNHRSDAGWSSQENGLWYTPAYPDDAFDRDWATIARRYGRSAVVIGADLRNEPHGAASWGDGNPATDWRAAANRAGSAVLRANPHLLVIVEGVQFYGNAPSYWWGGNLMGVATAPVTLHFADGSDAHSQLVYSAHDYGRDNCSTGCPWLNDSTTYDSLARTWDQYWGYISADPTLPYAAPVWLGEFGTCNYNTSCVSSTVPGSQGQWFSSLIRYLGERHLSWSYWSANGTQSTGGTRIYGDLDWYGFFTRDWSAPDSLIADALRTIQVDAPATPPDGGPRLNGDGPAG